MQREKGRCRNMTSRRGEGEEGMTDSQTRKAESNEATMQNRARTSIAVLA